jgi:hypothetical protein
MLQDNAIISTVCLEHQVLQHIKDAMRVTLNWVAPEVSLPRKLASLQFTTQSFQRHLERVMSIEEEGGYMADVLDEKPYLEDRLNGLAGDHARFRARLRQLMPEFDGLSKWNESQFVQLCDELSALLNEVDQHDAREVGLLQESFAIDDGGEG